MMFLGQNSDVCCIGYSTRLWRAYVERGWAPFDSLDGSWGNTRARVPHSVPPRATQLEQGQVRNGAE
jgi:hypothetical protein